MASTDPGRSKSPLQAPDENAALDAPEGAASAPSSSIVFSWFKLFLGGVLVLGLSVGLFFSVYRYAMTTPRFAVEHIEVKGNQRLSETQVVRLAGVETGQNVFALDTSRAQQRLLAEPWVERARVSRELPATLRIELTERVAVAVALVEGDLFLVTSDGEPFKKV
jgi:cell division protein FtsQ